MTAANGKLIGWEISQRSNHLRQDTILATLKFDHKSNLAALISVNLTGEVSGLYFAPIPIAARPATSLPSAAANNFDSIELLVGHVPFEQCGTITIPTTGSGLWPGVVLNGCGYKDGPAGANYFFKDLAGVSARDNALSGRSRTPRVQPS